MVVKRTCCSGHLAVVLAGVGINSSRVLQSMTETSKANDE
jgi:hypothetical protein